MNYQLDDIDKKILDFLVENTRMPFTEIAKQMDVSAGTIHVRVKKMEDAGIILGSSLNIDYGKLDYNFTLCGAGGGVHKAFFFKIVFPISEL